MLYFSDETRVGSTHNNDEVVLPCCTSVMRLELEVLITMMRWYYCSGCSQDLLDDIQIAPIHDDKFLAIYFELQQFCFDGL